MEENISTNNEAETAQIANLSARTEASFTQYSRVFLWWGAIALADFVIQFLYKYIRQMITDQNMHNSDMVVSNFQAFQTSALIGIIWLAVILAGWHLVYLFLAPSVKPKGMSKELIKLWGWSIVVTLISIIPTIVSVSYGYATRALFNLPLEPDLYLISIFILRQFLWFIFALMMVVTAAFTRTKTYLWFALLLALFGMIVQSGTFAYPVTFLLLGGYLEWKRRGNIA